MCILRYEDSPFNFHLYLAWSESVSRGPGTSTTTVRSYARRHRSIARCSTLRRIAKHFGPLSALFNYFRFPVLLPASKVKNRLMRQLLPTRCSDSGVLASFTGILKLFCPFPCPKRRLKLLPVPVSTRYFDFSQ